MTWKNRKTARRTIPKQSNIESEKDDPNHRWCFCQEPQGDNFMICCDGRGKVCFRWYYGVCVGISPSEGRRMESQGEPFVYNYCSAPPALPCYTPANKRNFVWSSSVDGDLFRERISKACSTIVH